MAARPRYGSSASAVAFTSSSNSATSTMRRGAAASSRRATACPTSPLPPKIIAVRSRSSMESLDGLDLLRREPPVLALGESPETHRSIRHAVRSEEHTSELQSLAYLVCRLILSKEHTSELQSLAYLVCRLLLEKKKKKNRRWSALRIPRKHSAKAIGRSTSQRAICCGNTGRPQ